MGNRGDNAENTENESEGVILSSGEEIEEDDIEWSGDRVTFSEGLGSSRIAERRVDGNGW